ncbi:hypothetical protein PM082_009557 [Marasmius tenuissimus]|nr:hypothetical protein PM082_009557 [Marasmius tenuissimus]
MLSAKPVNVCPKVPSKWPSTPVLKEGRVQDRDETVVKAFQDNLVDVSQPSCSPRTQASYRWFRGLPAVINLRMHLAKPSTHVLQAFRRYPHRRPP